MPYGVVTTFNPSTGQARIAKSNRVYTAEQTELERDARNVGARVHFDIQRGDDQDIAVNVELRQGTRVSRRQGRLGHAGGKTTHEGDPSIREVTVEQPTAQAMTVVVRGDVSDSDVELATSKVLAVLDKLDEEALFVRVKLTEDRNPAIERSSHAQASVDLGGSIMRAQIADKDMRDAIDHLQNRLLRQLEHRAQHTQAAQRRPASTPEGEWRRGDAPTMRPDHFVRPAEERELIRQKTFSVDELTPDEAAFDLEQLDYDFHLFQDLASGHEAVIERTGSEAYRLTRLAPAEVETGPQAIELETSDNAVSDLTVEQALHQLAESGQTFIFFRNSETDNGNVVYTRYDGHYGLITAAKETAAQPA